jgi:hypothetical protein
MSKQSDSYRYPMAAFSFTAKLAVPFRPISIECFFFTQVGIATSANLLEYWRCDEHSRPRGNLIARVCKPKPVAL